jgi:hypothetical protein
MERRKGTAIASGPMIVNISSDAEFDLIATHFLQ